LPPVERLANQAIDAGACRGVQHARRHGQHRQAGLGNWLPNKSAEVDVATGEILSHRGREILRLLGQGLSSLQIADRLNISRRTVDSHRVHLLNKLGLDSASSLIGFAVTRTGNAAE